MAKSDGTTETKRDRIDAEPEVESLMSVEEFGSTNKVNRVLLAGFIQYTKTSKMPPRLTAKQWAQALTNWQRAPVTV